MKLQKNLVEKSIKDTIGTGTTEGLNAQWIANIVNDALSIDIENKPNELLSFIEQNANFFERTDSIHGIDCSILQISAIS